MAGRLIDMFPFVRRSTVGPCLSVLAAATLAAAVQSTAGLVAQAPRQEDAPRIPDAVLTGTVTDAAGAPIAGARLTLTRMSADAFGTTGGMDFAVHLSRVRESSGAHGFDPDAVSSSDGAFRIAGASRETAHRLHVVAPGFLPASVDLPAVGPVGAPDPVHVVLGRGSRVQGTVVDPLGQPVPGANIELIPERRGPRGEAVPNAEMVRAVESDANGRFELPATAAGNYQLNIAHPDFVSESPSRVAVPAGESDTEVGALVVMPGMEIEGVVRGPDRHPIDGAVVRAYQIGAMPSVQTQGIRTAATDASGRFRLGGLHDRAVQVGVAAHGYAPSFLTVASSTADRMLEIELSHGAALTGRVIDSRGDPVPGTRVRPMQTGTVIGQVDPRLDWRQDRSVETGADGRFRLDSLRSGPWQLSVFDTRTGMGMTERETIRLQNGEVRDVEIVLSAEEDGIEERPQCPGCFIHSVEDDAATEPGLEIAGSVRAADGRPVALALVEARREPSPDEAERSPNDATVFLRRGSPRHPIKALTDREGAYRLTGLDDGFYSLRVWAEGYGADPIGPVRVDGHSLTGIDIVLQAEATIAVRLVGAPSDLVEVHAVKGNEHRQARRSAAGEVRIESLGPGQWTVIAREFNGRTVERTLGLSAGDAETVELRFEKGLRLSGLATVAGQATAGGEVMVLAEESGARRWGDLDLDGRFEMVGLTPGVYIVDIALASRTAYRRTVELRTDRDIHFDLAPPAVLAGLVVDAETGQPLFEATVVTIAGDDSAGGMAPTDADGRFELRSAPGAWDLLVESDGYAEQRLAVELESAEIRQGLVFELHSAPP